MYFEYTFVPFTGEDGTRSHAALSCILHGTVQPVTQCWILVKVLHLCLWDGAWEGRAQWGLSWTGRTWSGQFLPRCCYQHCWITAVPAQFLPKLIIHRKLSWTVINFLYRLINHTSTPHNPRVHRQALLAAPSRQKRGCLTQWLLVQIPADSWQVEMLFNVQELTIKEFYMSEWLMKLCRMHTATL